MTRGYHPDSSPTPRRPSRASCPGLARDGTCRLHRDHDHAISWKSPNAWAYRIALSHRAAWSRRHAWPSCAAQNGRNDQSEDVFTRWDTKAVAAELARPGPGSPGTKSGRAGANGSRDDWPASRGANAPAIICRCLCRGHASAGLCISAGLPDLRAAADQIHPDRHHGDDLPGRGP